MRPEGAERLSLHAPFSGSHYWIAPVVLLFLAQLCVVTLFGPTGAGPALADGIELAIFLLSVYVFVRAARSSHHLARSFWFPIFEGHLCL